MSSTATDVANEALIRLSASQILSIDDSSKVAVKCKTLLPTVRKALFRFHPWNCLLTRAAIAASGDAPSYGFTQKYRLPSDRLLLWEIDGHRPTFQDFALESGYILISKAAPLKIRYVRDTTSYSELDPHLYETLVLKLAASLAMSITGKRSFAESLKEEYRVSLADATYTDSAETGYQKPYGEDDWNLARLGGNTDDDSFLVSTE